MMFTFINKKFVKQMGVRSSRTAKDDVRPPNCFGEYVRMRYCFGMSDRAIGKNFILPHRPGKPYWNTPIIINFKDEIVHSKCKYDSVSHPIFGFGSRPFSVSHALGYHNKKIIQ